MKCIICSSLFQDYLENTLSQDIIDEMNNNFQLCEKCNTETKICAHPNLARWSEDAVGVNVKKTAANAGIEVTFPFAKTPESFALLLID